MSAESSAAAGGVILVARFAATAALNYGLGLALAWLLVPAAFGVVSTIQNVLLLTAGVVTAGLPWALAIRIAQTHGEPEKARPEFRTALLANTSFGILLGAGFAAAQLSGMRLIPTDSAPLDLIVAAEMPALALNSVLAGAAQGSRRFGGLGTMQTAEILVKCLAAVFAVTVLRAGPAGVAASFLAGTVVSVLIGARVNRGLLPGPGPLAGPGFLHASGSIWFASATMTFLITADLLGLQVAGRAAAVTTAVLAGYQACSLLARASFYVSDAIADAVFPFLAKSQTPADRHRWFAAGARWVPAAIVPIQLALCLAPGPVLGLFLPHQYAAVQPLLRVLAAGTVGTLLVDMLVKSLFAIGLGSRVGRLMPAGAVVEVACLAALVPRYGALGAAFSCLIASYASLALLIPLYLRNLQVRLPSPKMAAGYLTGLAPAGLCFAAAGWLPAASWGLIACGLTAALLSARLNGLIRDSDVGAARAFLGRAAGRMAAALRRAAPGVPAAESGQRSLAGAVRAEWATALCCAAAAAFALGYNLFNSPDILYDEAAYTFTAQRVALTGQLSLANAPLFVHPPLMFLLQAGWLWMTGNAASALPTAIHAARLLAATAGGLDVLLIAAMAYRLAGGATRWQRRVVTGAAALLAAFDPVLVRYDRQDVIEPFALCATLVTLHAAWQLRDRRLLPYVSVTGLLGGLALLTNEITIFLIVVPLIFALLERDRRLAGHAAAAIATSAAFLLVFFLWSAEIGQAGSFVSVQTATLQRLIGIVQITGLHAPGVSLVGSLRRSLAQYSSSYIVLAAGCTALVWCWARRNTRRGNFLTAWLTASYGLGVYIAAIGTLNEQFFVYILPASIAGTVLLADALVTGTVRRAGRARPGQHRHGPDRHGPGPRRAVTVLGGALLAGGAGLASLSAASWAGGYTSTSNAVVLADRFIAANLPPCAVVNASGDAQKYSLVLGGRSFADFYVGPTALAFGVNYFLLSPNDAAEREGDMSPALASWIRAHGTRLASYPSKVYQSIQLWHVPAGRYDPAADIVHIPGGVYVTTRGAQCGGYRVTNAGTGSFYSGYRALGGKAVLGVPLSGVERYGRDSHAQLFSGAVLATVPGHGTAARALPVVRLLAERRPAAYRRAGLPRVAASAGAAARRRWLTNPSITRAYLAGRPESPASYAAAVRRFGEPLGPPSALPGAGAAQAFADVVLETRGRAGAVHAAAVTPVARAAGLLPVPAAALRPQRPPRLPDPPPLGRPVPAPVRPFVLSLGAALLLYGIAVAALGTARRRRVRVPAGQRQWARDAA